MRGRFQDWAGNLTLLFCSFLATLLLLDFVVFPQLLTAVPLKLQPEFREPALRTLTQSSKRAAVPAGDWIALAGDSYAAGEGDRFRSVDQDRNPPFHSAHLIDVRPYARAATEQAVLHGPIDWRHLNRAGHEMLSGAVVDFLSGGSAPGCAKLAVATP